MGYESSQLDSQAERDRINPMLRASSQWRSAIQRMGLSPDGPLRLTRDQQRSLGTQLGLPLSDFKIDGAGNINDFHGWKGLPTWAKTAIIAGAAVGTAGAGGMFSGAPGAFGLGTGGGAAAASGGATAANVGATAGTGGLLANAGLPASAYLTQAPSVASMGTSAAGGGGLLGGLKKVGNALIGRTGKQIADEAKGDGFDWTKLIPLGLSTASAIRGATRGPTQGELALDKMMASAQNRVDTMEPTFQALAKMVQSQLPDYTKGRQ